MHSQHMTVGSHRLHYLKAGNGPPIVLLHGGASDSRDWASTIASLSDRFALYAPDMPGFGLSDRDGNGYYLSDLAEAVIGFIDALALGKVVLAGHSMGGRVSLDIALRRPDLIQKLVLVDSMGFGKTSPLARGMGTVSWAVRRLLGRPHPFPNLLVAQGEDYDWICLERLPELAMPTLIVWNRWDPFFSVKGAIEAAKLIPEPTLAVLSGWGHSPHVSASERFNRVLIDFIQD